MDELDVRQLVDDIQSGDCSPDEAVARLRRLPFTELGYAKVDHHRPLRQGMVEAIYGPGKTPQQCAGIVDELLGGGSGPVLLTRATAAQASAALERCPGGSACRKARRRATRGSGRSTGARTRHGPAVSSSARRARQISRQATNVSLPCAPTASGRMC